MGNSLRLNASLRKSLFIDPSHPDFEGHFPGFQLLPAVSQIDLVVDLLSLHFGQTILCTGVSKAKFKAMLRPGTSIDVDVEGVDDGKVRWMIKDDHHVYSQGTLSYVPAPPRDAAVAASP